MLNKVNIAYYSRINYDEKGFMPFSIDSLCLTDLVQHDEGAFVSAALRHCIAHSGINIIKLFVVNVTRKIS
jgi:hypothetical protein